MKIKPNYYCCFTKANQTSLLHSSIQNMVNKSIYFLNSQKMFTSLACTTMPAINIILEFRTIPKAFFALLQTCLPHLVPF